jgi:glycosyltransferase involved in cell wall biosynthesis
MSTQPALNPETLGHTRASVMTAPETPPSQRIVPLDPRRAKPVDVSVVIPCLNEAPTVAACVRQAIETFEANGIAGEVILCDNGSTDGSDSLAREAGAFVVYESRPGYGSAYLRAFEEARGKYLVMADADGTYDMSLIPQFVEPLKNGYDLVMGIRKHDTMDAGAQPFLHKYVGVPVLTGLLNILSGSEVSDAHCGMRGFTREAIDRMNLRTTGMEFASEMILKAHRYRLKTTEFAIPYYARPEDSESKLRTFSDGWRHLRYLLLESPTFLYVIPGLLLMAMGIGVMAALTPGAISVGAISFDFHYMIVGSLAALVGWQAVTLGIFAKVYAVVEELAPSDRMVETVIKRFNLEKALLASGAVAAVGAALMVWTAASWIGQGFGFANPTAYLRPALLGATLFGIGTGSGFSAFFVGALLMERRVNVVQQSRPAMVAAAVAAPAGQPEADGEAEDERAA